MWEQIDLEWEDKKEGDKPNSPCLLHVKMPDFFFSLVKLEVWNFMGNHIKCWTSLKRKQYFGAKYKNQQGWSDPCTDICNFCPQMSCITVRRTHSQRWATELGNKGEG